MSKAAEAPLGLRIAATTISGIHHDSHIVCNIISYAIPLDKFPSILFQDRGPKRLMCDSRDLGLQVAVSGGLPIVRSLMGRRTFRKRDSSGGTGSRRGLTQFPSSVIRPEPQGQ
jgi:hypothetical protein